MERFWSKVDRRGPNECWPWLAGVFRERGGYGAFRHNGKATGAHRVALALSGGRAPAGAVVRHACDNPICCNPAHLLIGTHGDNVADKVSRGRQLRGERVSTHILTNEDVAFIRASALSQSALARMFGVSQVCVCNARTGKTWAHLPGARRHAS